MSAVNRFFAPKKRSIESFTCKAEASYGARNTKIEYCEAITSKSSILYSGKFIATPYGPEDKIVRQSFRKWPILWIDTYLLHENW
jgi:hypothetical protein